MAVTSVLSSSLTFSGDITASVTIPAASNALAPGDIDVFTLSAGDNTIPLPTGGSTPSGAVILPPAGNIQTLKLKGAGGDTGIFLHKLNPANITFDSPPPANIILNAGGTITGLRIAWT